jgi:hypothetical protein
MVGHWRGTVTTPWVPAYGAFIAFEADGHYATRSLDAVEPVFYYGTDLDTDVKTWTLDYVTARGLAYGAIDIAFQYGATFGLPVWQGQLRDVKIDDVASRLELSFSRSDGYGPIHYDLWRCAE